MSYEIVTKYIKDLNFKIDDAKSYFLLEKDIKNYTFVCDIKSKKLKSIAIVCGLAPHDVKGMNRGRVGMLINYGKKPFISWMLLHLLRINLLKNNIEKNFNRWKNKIPLPKSDSKLFTIDRGIRLMENFKGIFNKICVNFSIINCRNIIITINKDNITIRKFSG